MFVTRNRYAIEQEIVLISVPRRRRRIKEVNNQGRIETGHFRCGWINTGAVRACKITSGIMLALHNSNSGAAYASVGAIAFSTCAARLAVYMQY